MKTKKKSSKNFFILLIGIFALLAFISSARAAVSTPLTSPGCTSDNLFCRFSEAADLPITGGILPWTYTILKKGYTYNQRYGSGDSYFNPKCPCDTSDSTKDCATSFVYPTDLGNICYDHYLGNLGSHRSLRYDFQPSLNYFIPLGTSSEWVGVYNFIISKYQVKRNDCVSADGSSANSPLSAVNTAPYKTVWWYGASSSFGVLVAQDFTDNQCIYNLLGSDFLPGSCLNLHTITNGGYSSLQSVDCAYPADNSFAPDCVIVAGVYCKKQQAVIGVNFCGGNAPDASWTYYSCDNRF